MDTNSYKHELGQKAGLNRPPCAFESSHPYALIILSVETGTNKTETSPKCVGTVGTHGCIYRNRSFSASTLGFAPASLETDEGHTKEP
eukprot:1182510-Prorocentrum_minimum.AAC.10